MKNNSNIYDIDGELIRAYDDTHKITVQEAQEKIDFYKKKLENLEKDDQRYQVYTTYIRNLTNYVIDAYSKMSKDEINNELTRLSQNKTTTEQIEKAINELKEEIESETPEGEGSRAQEDLLVEGEGRPETVMDSYVEYEEVE